MEPQKKRQGELPAKRRQKKSSAKEGRSAISAGNEQARLLTSLLYWICGWSCMSIHPQ